MEPLESKDPRRLGVYTLLGRLGSGGMGRVYLGEDDAGQRAAIKVVYEGQAGENEFRRRFGREIVAATRVQGPWTAKVLTSDTTADQPWMATEYIDGRSLARTVESDGPLVTEQVLDLAAGLAEALKAIHAAGVIHRDLKPSNVILTDDGPRVIDFGIAHATEASTITRTSQISGSVGFMSPEQASGDAPVQSASDVFSLGAVLYFAAAGRPPFGSGPVAERIVAVISRDSDLSVLADDRVRGIVAACLAKDPARRPVPADIGAMARGERLELGSEETVVRTRPVSPRGRRRGLAVAAIVLVSLMVIAGVAFGDPGLRRHLRSQASGPAPTASDHVTVVRARPPTGVIPTGSPDGAPTTGPTVTGTAAVGSVGPNGVLTVVEPGSITGPSSSSGSKRLAAPIKTTSKARKSAAQLAPTYTTADCENASHSGSLSIADDATPIAGGPNYVPKECTSIYLQLTSVQYITYAMACPETSAGAELYCGAWVFLQDKGAWNDLLDGVTAGQRWKLELKGEGTETVGFLFSA